MKEGWVVYVDCVCVCTQRGKHRVMGLEWEGLIMFHSQVFCFEQQSAICGKHTLA